jgi:iron complex outermembrane receptor protein
VVTAQLRRESAQSVPVAVTAISGDTLARNNVASLQDLSGAVPGVVVSKSVSYGLAPIAIRGLGGPAGGGSLFTDQPVAVYVDGVYVPALGQSVSDFLDLDTLQVLRGPQGTLYGRNSTAGAILVTGKRPDLSAIGGYVTAGYASFDEFKLAGALNLPLITDTLGLRIAASRSGGDWAHNTFDSRSFGGGDSTNLRASLRWKPSSDTTVDLIVDHSEGNSRPATVPLSTISAAPRGPALGTVYVGNPYARRSDFDSVLNDRQVSIAGPQYTRTLSTDATLLAEIGLGAVKLTSITGYRDFQVRGAQDVTPAAATAVSLNTNNTVQKQKSFSQELRLGADAGRFKRWARTTSTRTPTLSSTSSTCRAAAGRHRLARPGRSLPASPPAPPRCSRPRKGRCHCPVCRRHVRPDRPPHGHRRHPLQPRPQERHDRQQRAHHHQLGARGPGALVRHLPQQHADLRADL